MLEDVTVVVLVPRREDGGHRDRLWRFVKKRWQQVAPNWEVFEGHHNEGLFNRSAAINAAAEAAGDWDAAIIADADSFVWIRQAYEAVERALATDHIVYAHDEFLYLDKLMSQRVVGGFSGDMTPGVHWKLENTVSSQIAVSRALWDDVRGFDPKFVGWGMEDVAFSTACETLHGGERVHGPVWHLWHPPAKDPPGTADRNREYLGEYLVRRGDPAAMRAFVEAR